MGKKSKRKKQKKLDRAEAQRDFAKVMELMGDVDWRRVRVKLLPLSRFAQPESSKKIVAAAGYENIACWRVDVVDGAVVLSLYNGPEMGTCVQRIATEWNEKTSLEGASLDDLYVPVVLMYHLRELGLQTKSIPKKESGKLLGFTLLLITIARHVIPTGAARRLFCSFLEHFGQEHGVYAPKFGPTNPWDNTRPEGVKDE